GVRITVAAEERWTQRRTAGLLARQRFAAQSCPRRLVESLPAGWRETAVAQQPRRHVGGHQRTLDQQRTAAAHRVQQRTAVRVNLRPAPAQQHRGGEVLLQWCLTLLLAPATAGHRAAPDIDRDDRAARAAA